MIWKIWMICEMIWKIWKKSKLKSEMIWKIWKKGKLNSEMIWKIWKISVLVIITPKETSSSSSSSAAALVLLPLCMYIQNWESSSWNSFFCLLETMQVGIKFTISFIWLLGYLVPPQWERDRLLGVLHNLSENTVDNGNNKITELRTILQRESQNS